jgi:deaminated glutathione amidase
VSHGEPAPGTLCTAVLQLSSQAAVAENLERVDALVRDAAAAGARLLVLPENFAFFGAESDKRAIAERLGDAGAPIQAALRRLAARERVTLIAGGFPEQSTDPERPHNTSIVISPAAEIVAAYRKIHLFDVELGRESYRESQATFAGDEVVSARIEGFEVGLSICYDLRFPELYRRLVERGAELLSVPAAFTLNTGKEHWHVLLRARAIESQCYVLAAAQWGSHPGNRSTYGHALICDPWGTVIAEASDRVGFVSARIERAFLQQVRARVPALSHRRL